jgi:hypothetical protein
MVARRARARVASNGAVAAVGEEEAEAMAVAVAVEAAVVAEAQAATASNGNGRADGVTRLMTAHHKHANMRDSCKVLRNVGTWDLGFGIGIGSWEHASSTGTCRFFFPFLFLDVMYSHCAKKGNRINETT